MKTVCKILLVAVIAGLIAIAIGGQDLFSLVVKTMPLTACTLGLIISVSGLLILIRAIFSRHKAPTGRTQ